MMLDFYVKRIAFEMENIHCIDCGKKIEFPNDRKGYRHLLKIIYKNRQCLFHPQNSTAGIPVDL